MEPLCHFLFLFTTLWKKSLYPCYNDSFYLGNCLFTNTRTVNLTRNLSFSRKDKCETCAWFQQIFNQLKNMRCYGNRTLPENTQFFECSCNNTSDVKLTTFSINFTASSKYSKIHYEKFCSITMTVLLFRLTTLLSCWQSK